jgi:hypothetical protein
MAEQQQEVPAHECPNCGHELRAEDQFCSRCGQRNHDLHLPLKHLFQEVFEDLFHFEHRSLQTLRRLVFSPGTLTKEFLAGRRTRFVAPIRFYVFISVLFFFVLSLPSPHEAGGPEQSETKLNISFFQQDAIESSKLLGVQPSQADSILTLHHKELTMWNRYVVRQLIKLENEGRERFNHMLLKSLSYMMFVLMPLFAAAVFLFYRKQAQHYISTLIFSVHYHTFIFFLFTVVTLLSLIGLGGWLAMIGVVLCPVYLFLALRRMYGGSRGRTILKTIGIGALQMVSLALLFLLTAVISVMLF